MSFQFLSIFHIEYWYLNDKDENYIIFTFESKSIFGYALQNNRKGKELRKK